MLVLVMYALYYVPLFSVGCFSECMLSSTVHVFLNELETCYTDMSFIASFKQLLTCFAINLLIANFAKLSQ